MATSLCFKASLSTAGRPGTIANRSTNRVPRALVVRTQAVKLPTGVTVPPKQPEVPPPRTGFVDFAERLNSRAAMIGFFALLAVEGIFGKGLLELIGVTTGNGLGFEL
ncbi:hypothetical protein Agub_g10313 [Astrephomene gubernaculifera]|uniref:Uncharacterized protein n=1 Tax=Astrephomene gubernaculifera TaxID=47775 RepID=A0AAD3DV49_9CHLO|nr:hypothetical protein Agub_g10313 [Astrephomene gubernaculifera]